MLKTRNNCTSFSASLINSQSLAYVGDAVYSLFVRDFLLVSGNAKASELHTLSSKFVKATAQCEHLENIMSELTEEEKQVVKRAANYKTNNTAKHAEIHEYKQATGFEALLGYLYISGQGERLNYILDLGIKGGELCN